MPRDSLASCLAHCEQNLANPCDTMENATYLNAESKGTSAFYDKPDTPQSIRYMQACRVCVVTPNASSLEHANKILPILATTIEFMRLLTCSHEFMRLLTCAHEFMRLLTCAHEFMRLLTAAHEFMRLLTCAHEFMRLFDRRA